ncbi:MAG: hypothetical protein ACLFQF_07995 [Rhodosalinus sp.]
MAEAIAVAKAAMRRASAGGTGRPSRHAAPPRQEKPGARWTRRPRGHHPRRSARAMRRGISLHQSVVARVEAETGGCVAMAEAGLPTALRGPAASAVATRAPASGGAAGFAPIGSGKQAGHRLQAICAVRPPTRASVTGRGRRADRISAGRG